MKCLHPKKNDLTQGLGTLGRHFFCPDCKWHSWAGREWTKEEWEDHVNIDPESGEDWRKKVVKEFPF